MTPTRSLWNIETKVARMSIDLDWKADTRSLHRTFDSILATDPDAIKKVADTWLTCALAERDVPDYIEVDHSKMAAKLGRIPAFGEVPYPVMMEPHLVVEYYSR